MRYELSNNKQYVYQWDQRITLTITEPENVPEIHFRWGDQAVPIAVTDQQVAIPPELMQLPQDIVLWAYTPDHTMDMAKIPLYQRAKPDGYVYTPTEIKTWEELDERIKVLEDANVQPNWAETDPTSPAYIADKSLVVYETNEFASGDWADDFSYFTSSWLPSADDTIPISLQINGDMYNDLPRTQGSYGAFTYGDVDKLGVEIRNPGHGNSWQYVNVSAEKYPDGVSEAHVYATTMVRLPDDAAPEGLAKWVGETPDDYVKLVNVTYVRDNSPVRLKSIKNETLANADTVYFATYSWDDCLYVIHAYAARSTKVRNIKLKNGTFAISVMDGSTLRGVQAEDIPLHGIMICKVLTYGGANAAILINQA